MPVVYLLDTDVLSEPLRPHPDALVLEALDAHADECAISAVTWSESLYGVYRLPAGRRQAQYIAYLDEVVLARFPILVFGEEEAHWLAIRRAALESLGRPLPFADGMIAATAAVNDLTLVTRNVRHFEGIPGLRIVSWHRPV
jgi:tRNA(fMet)-specific endonuclease VapC